MRVGANFCPGIVHAVPAKDGLLLRIRVPGGLIEADQFRTVANLAGAFADGTIEITSRANLQIRAVGERDLNHIVEALCLAGLLPSPQHDRVRNIVTSPLAGVDDEELLDPRPLVVALDRRLRGEALFVDLHPKFSFAIFGGSRRFSGDRDDIDFSAVRVGDTTLLRLSLAGTTTGFAVQVEDVVEIALTVAAAFLALASEFHVPARARQILEISGALDRILDPLMQWLTPCSEIVTQRGIDETPLGVCRAVQQDRANIIPSVPLGRLSVEQARCVADVVCDSGADLRLAQWRGVVITAATQSAVESIVGRLVGVGLPCDGRDGFRGIAACAGIAGCDASMADVRRDAVSMAQLLAGRGIKAGWTVNLSGCEKQCGRRHRAAVDLIATPAGYEMRLDGRVAAHVCSSTAAIDAVAALHENMMAEVAAQ